MSGEPAARSVPAPGLRETAEIWWDATVDPIVTWDGEGRRFWLVHPSDPAQRLALLVRDEPVAEPRSVARALAEGLAACDFPPTAEGVPPGRADATLRAAGVRA